MREMPPRLTYIQDFERAEDFLNHLLPWNYAGPRAGHGIYRGHAQDKYSLLPNSLRNSGEILWRVSRFSTINGSHDFEHSFAEAEFRLLKEFFRRADAAGLPLPHSGLLRESLHQSDFDLKALFHQNCLKMPLASDPIATAEHLRRHLVMPWLPNEFFEIAGLAQHYGIPTRLLDWSYDPFIAAFFALKGALNLTGRLAVWYLPTGNLREAEGYCGGKAPLHIITPPYAQNPNLAAQRGVFTLWPQTIKMKADSLRFVCSERDVFQLKHHLRWDDVPSDFRSLDELLKSWILVEMQRRKGSISDKNKMTGRDESSHRWKGVLFHVFTLPCSEAGQGLYLLSKLGYDHSRLFPGYGGIAQDVLNA
jgi:hypothetical protein